MSNFTPKQERIYQEVKYEIFEKLRKGERDDSIMISLIMKGIGIFDVMAKELIARAKTEI
jgi:hypothetical protein